MHYFLFLFLFYEYKHQERLKYKIIILCPSFIIDNSYYHEVRIPTTMSNSTY